jgi:hypothetical protein
MNYYSKTVRLTEELHKNLKDIADSKNITIFDLVNEICEIYLKKTINKTEINEKKKINKYKHITENGYIVKATNTHKTNIWKDYA